LKGKPPILASIIAAAVARKGCPKMMGIQRSSSISMTMKRYEAFPNLKGDFLKNSHGLLYEMTHFFRLKSWWA